MVSAKRRRKSGTSGGRAISPAAPNRVDIPARPDDYRQMDRRAQIGVLIVALILIGVVVIGADFVLGAISGPGTAPSATPSATSSATPSASPTPFGVVVPGMGGDLTNVSLVDKGRT
jgi:hypothetical protein